MTEALVGSKILRIFMDEEDLVFVTDNGDFAYTVHGDCCSYSYFYDFIGVGKLLENGPVISMSAIDTYDPDDEDTKARDVVQAYGFEIVTEHPLWGEQTSVLSFRNDSNGYYGGWMELAVNGDRSGRNWNALLPELFEDCLSTQVDQ